MAAQRLLSLQEPKESHSDLARRLGIEPRTMHAYYRGDSGASVESVERAVRIGGINAHWLLTGEGPRYREALDRVPTGEGHRRLMDALEKAQGVVEDLAHVAGLRAPDLTEALDPDVEK